MAAKWGAALDEQFMGATVDVGKDGSGTITASVRWPDALRHELTRQFAECIKELWSALDSLVSETVQLFSSSRTQRGPDAPRFWPIADSQENLELLLSQSCINGVLRAHANIIRTSQPFLSDSSIDQLQRVRVGLRQLLVWGQAVDSGESITVWATPVEPTIITRPHREGIVWTLSPSFDLGSKPDGIVASFFIPAYQRDMQVSARPGTFLDLGFAAGFVPTQTDDTFESRLEAVIGAVALLHAHFGALTNKVHGTRALPIGHSDREDLWRSASQSPRFWRRSELAELTKTGARVAVVVDPDPTELVLLIPTADGVFERRIPNATKLRSSDTVGIAAERAVHEAVATWGLPDFVMKPQVERKGSGVREVGDGLLVAGDVGAIVQVKGRSAELSTSEREAHWIDKNIDKAVRQVNGTYRRLQQSPVDFENGRGRTLHIDGRAVRWVGVIVIDHAQIPEQHPVLATSMSLPTVVLIRRDWEFLFEQLKSTSAVIRYLLRVEASSEYLGEEPHRYFDLASLDASAPPNELDPKVARLGTVFHHPLLPMEPAGGRRPTEFGLIRLICEDIADIEDDARTPDMEVQVFAAIDALPVSSREELGSLLYSELKEKSELEDVRWRFRTFLPSIPGGYQVSFAVCSVYNETTANAFQAWVMLRHSERGEDEDISAARSIAVLLTPRWDGLRPWDTTLLVVEGDLQLSEETLASYTEFWGRRGMAAD